jgi:hypothetical protein
MTRHLYDLNLVLWLDRRLMRAAGSKETGVAPA